MRLSVPLSRVVLALCFFGCSSEKSSDAEAPIGEPDGGGGAGCEELADSCLETQRVCVEGAEGARCEVCPQGEYASPDTKRCAALAGTPLVHEYADFEVAAGEEILSLCQSWTLGNDEEIWVNAVELVQDNQSHHSNWLFVPEDRFEGPDGVWPCKERNYSQLEAAIAGGVLYAQSTQAKKEVQKFPDGVALRIPPRSRIIGDVHLLNVSDQPVNGHVTLRVYPIPAADVDVKLAPFHLTYDELAIPPQQTSRFFGECNIEETSQAVLQTPLSMKVYFVLPHTHALGSRFFVEVLGGPRDGESIMDISGFNSEARGRYYTPPVDMAGATGFRFGCEFENPRTETVGWGFGDQEMCEMLGFVESDIAFESRVSTVESAGEDDGIPTFTGACNTIGFQFSQTK
jgi:hypothetical protein